MSKFLSSPIALVLVLLILGVSAVKLFRTVSLYLDVRHARGKLQAELAYLEAENQKISDELRIADTPEAIERDAKGRLNLKMPDEEVVVVVPNSEKYTATTTEDSPWRHFTDLLKSFLPF
ncbi:MAG: septum formation initiator family protein [Candidatus Sungbacteria bacterium]|nr:septum formation initiator family protein [Candidatus Sungbacteria bacterium]